MNTTLATFQDDFFQALLTPPDEVPGHLRDLLVQPGFAIYRNTVLKGCIDALQGNYPTVSRLVGDDWFQAAAALHARSQPPGDSRMVLYGADFPNFLRHFEPAAETLAQLGALVLQPHPAARWAWFEAQPVYTIWRRNRASGGADEDAAQDFAWTGEGALLTRPTAAVRWTGLDAAGCAFLDACAAGRTLAHA
ncbi:MAG: DUF2063 domain-containing protein, partial [Polaromonas sp. 28-63-22]